MHAHGHNHGLQGSWRTWLEHRSLQGVLVVLAIAAVATVAGLILLWPDGSGRGRAVEEARRAGIGSERLSARVESVTDARCSYSTETDRQLCRRIVVEPADGPDSGVAIELPEFNLAAIDQIPDIAAGDQIVIGYEPSTNFYFYADRERRSSLLLLAGSFALVVIALGRVRGVLALAAMGLTVVVLVAFVAPSVLDGNDPILVAVVAASAIAFITLYLTHGFNPTTTMALVGTLASLLLTLAISWWFFRVVDFTGLATEEGLTIPIIAGDVNLSSLLLAGAVLGALGALDDVTVTQVATVAELKHRNPALRTRELVASGIRVGREHIASTVNTLLLAYVGASMPLLLLFSASTQSLDIVANSELIAVEIVRTLCGSIGLVAAVPLTTVLAATLLGGGSGPPGDPTVAWDDFSPADDLDL